MTCIRIFMAGAACVVLAACNGPQNAISSGAPGGVSSRDGGGGKTVALRVKNDEQALSIARKYCEGLVELPPDCVARVRSQGPDSDHIAYIVTFAPRQPTSDADYYAEVVMGGESGKVVHLLRPRKQGGDGGPTPPHPLKMKPEEAVAIAREFCKDIVDGIPDDCPIKVSLEGREYVVGFVWVPPDKYVDGPDYYALVRVDAPTGKVTLVWGGR